MVNRYQLVDFFAPIWQKSGLFKFQNSFIGLGNTVKNNDGKIN